MRVQIRRPVWEQADSKMYIPNDPAQFSSKQAYLTWGNWAYPSA